MNRCCIVPLLFLYTHTTKWRAAKPAEELKRAPSKVHYLSVHQIPWRTVPVQTGDRWAPKPGRTILTLVSFPRNFMNAPPKQPTLLKFGPYLVDSHSGELRKNGVRIPLQEKPLRVLTLLASRRGEMVAREELRKYLWPDDTFVDYENGLNTAVRKLRRALCDDAGNPRYIETIPRRGYRFLVPVEDANSVSSARDNTAPVRSAIGEVAPTSVPAPVPLLDRVPFHKTRWLRILAMELAHWRRTGKTRSSSIGKRVIAGWKGAGRGRSL